MEEHALSLGPRLRQHDPKTTEILRKNQTEARNLHNNTLEDIIASSKVRSGLTHSKLNYLKSQHDPTHDIHPILD